MCGAMRPVEQLEPRVAACKLGSTLEQQKALYGDHYSTPYTAKDGTKYVLVEWEDGTELTIDYGPIGHCNHIRLAGGDQ